MTPSGLISVMPQACTMRTPWRLWKPSIRLRGTDDPPLNTMRSEERSTGCASA
jgi:hypothetical protein